MLTTQEDPIVMLDTGRSGGVYAVVFHPDGMHLLGGSGDGIRQWRLVDGQEVGKQMGMQLRAISISRDDKWIICGTEEGGANVWDAEMREKVIDVEGTTAVYATDVSPDSTTFATGTENDEASIWNMFTEERDSSAHSSTTMM